MKYALIRSIQKYRFID